MKRRTIENVIKSRWKCNFPRTLKSLHLSVRQWKKLFKFLSTDNKWNESDTVDFLHFHTQIVKHLYTHWDTEYNRQDLITIMSLSMTVIKICEFRTEFVQGKLNAFLETERMIYKRTQSTNEHNAVLLFCHVDAKVHGGQKEMSSSQKKKINIYWKHYYDRVWKGFWKKNLKSH